MADRDAIAMLRRFDPLRARDGGPAGLAYVLLDVFTDTPLQGNPLAVFADGRELSGEKMQLLAAELKLSETVFPLPAAGGGDVRIRIFTPQSELPFAGHPVLGAAIVVAGALGQPSVTLETGAGDVAVAVEPEEEPGRAFGRMDQPIPSWRETDSGEELLAALGVERAELPIEVYVNGPEHTCVTLANEAEVAALRPDMRALGALPVGNVSCFAGSGSSWKTRMFAPALGVPEDPATGSAAGPLCVHLVRHGLLPFGEQIEIRQGEEIGRPSRLYARVEGAGEKIERVQVAGSAVIVASGAFVL